MPNFTTDYSPFSVRIRPGKRQEESSGKKSNKILSLKNPSILGLSSNNNSANSTTSSETDYSSSEDMSSSMASMNASLHSMSAVQNRNLAFTRIFGTMKDTYGVEVRPPRKSDVMLYKR